MSVISCWRKPSRLLVRLVWIAATSFVRRDSSSPDPPPVEEADREALEVGIEAAAQIGHQPLPGIGEQIPLHDPDDAPGPAPRRRRGRSSGAGRSPPLASTTPSISPRTSQGITSPSRLVMIRQTPPPISTQRYGTASPSSRRKAVRSRDVRGSGGHTGRGAAGRGRSGHARSARNSSVTGKSPSARCQTRSRGQSAIISGITPRDDIS